VKIYGIFGSNRGEEELTAALSGMTSVLNPASHYRCESYTANGLAMGRLCSELTDKDAQPIWNEEHTRLIMTTGELFDYEARRRELLRSGHDLRNTKSDAEFILHAIEEWGDKAIECLNGNFVLALYDLPNRTLTIANDRHGMKPLYYHYTKPDFVFGSTVGAVIEDTSVRREINWEGWRDFFSFGYLLGTKTLFKNVYKLPSASILTVKEDGIVLRNYWSYTRINVDHRKPEESFVREGAQLVRRAIERRCMDLKECVVLLSGGYDSRCIAGTIKYYTETALDTLTTRNFGNIPWGFYPNSYVDAVLAGEVAKCIGVKNTYIQTPSSLWQQYFVRKTLLVDAMCHEHLWILPLVDRLGGEKVAFDGIAGDLLLGGVCLTASNIESTRSRDLKGLAYLLRQEERTFHAQEIAPPEIMSDLFHSPICEQLRPNVGSVFEELKRIGEHENIVTVFYIENRTRNAASVLPNLVASRAPCFLPFLDNDLVEFGLTIPPMMKVKNEIYFKILKALLPEVVKVPSSPHHEILSHARSHARECKPWYLLFLLAQFAKHSVICRISHSRRMLHRAAVEHLMDLIDSLPIPPYVNMEKVRERTRDCLSQNRDPSPFLVPMAEFCIWYSMVYLKRPSVGENEPFHKSF
jgi:asparagine synthase (glutamine-hydrolysing)